jgi:hypothetical protein
MSKSGLVGHISRFVVAIGIKKLMLVHGVLKLLEGAMKYAQWRRGASVGAGRGKQTGIRAARPAR